VISGAAATLTVTLSAPAPAGGSPVALSANPPGAFPAPANLTVPAGQSSASTPVTAGPVGSPTNATVTGTYGGNQYASLTVDPASVAPTTTITSSPQGLTIVVQGIPCTTPCSYQWAAGSNASVSATIGQAAIGTQYLFSYWSDGWPASHSIAVPSSSATYTAYFSPRVSVSGGISPSALEVNLGPLALDDYDGTTPNASVQAGWSIAACQGWITTSSNPIYQACMQYLLGNYAIQGVTGVRFQFNTASPPSKALTSPAVVSSTWTNHLSSFLNDLKAFGITDITPTPSWDDFGAWYTPNSLGTCHAFQSRSCTTVQAYQCTTGGSPGTMIQFAPPLPNGAVLDLPPGTREFDWRGGAGAGGEPERVAPLAA
jgi:hypothetical protein